MLFHNASDHELRFRIASLDYVVPVGAECDIPGPLAWVVKSRGLRLTEGKAPGGGEHVEPTAVVHKQAPVPSGVEIGEEPLEDEAGPVEVSQSVRSMTKQLEADGVNLRGRQKRR
ncbi:MAG TPA: hypothetical protein VFS15_25840 [Kofleriaceae bacterium]|nr:hypothetical protein [Kofleriaceae bacterium]